MEAPFLVAEMGSLGGQCCYVDRFISTMNGYRNQLPLISFFGREEEVKAVTAGFFNGKEITMEGGLYNKDYSHYSMLTRKTGNCLHRLVFSESMFRSGSSRCIIKGVSDSEIFSALASAIDCHYSTPVEPGPAWGSRFFAWLDEMGHIDELRVFGCDFRAFIMQFPSQDEIEEFIVTEIL